MYLIGIDFSINSTAMCVRDIEKDKCSFFWFPKKENGKKDKKDKYDLEHYMNVQFYESHILPSDDYSNKQKHHILNGHRLCNLLMEKINELGDIENVMVVIEGFSYGSISQSYIDIIVYQGILRSFLISKGLNFFIIPPTEIKKVFQGKGNASKEDMCIKFLEYENNDLNFIQKELKNSLNNNKVIKPFDDLVDSFAITEVYKKIKNL